MKKLLVSLALLFSATEAMGLVSLDAYVKLNIYNSRTRETVTISNPTSLSESDRQHFTARARESLVVRHILTDLTRENSCVREITRLAASREEQNALEEAIEQRARGAMIPNSHVLNFEINLIDNGTTVFFVRSVNMRYSPGIVQEGVTVTVSNESRSGAVCDRDSIVAAVSQAMEQWRSNESSEYRRQRVIETQRISTVDQMIQRLNIQRPRDQ